MRRIGTHSLLSALIFLACAGLVSSCASPTSGPLTKNLQDPTPDSLLDEPADPAIIDSIIKYSGRTFVVARAQGKEKEITAAPPDDLVEKALTEAGSLAATLTRYCFGSKHPTIPYTTPCGDLTGLDCSGLVSWCLEQGGLEDAPDGTGQQREPANWDVENFVVRSIPLTDPIKRGDLLIFNTSGGGASINHVGFYLGGQVTITTRDGSQLGPGGAIIHSAGKSDCTLLTESHGVQATLYPQSWLHLRKVVRIEKDVRRATWISKSQTVNIPYNRSTDTLHFVQNKSAQTAKLTCYYSPRDPQVQGFPAFTLIEPALTIELVSFPGATGTYPISRSTWRPPADQSTCDDLSLSPGFVTITKFDETGGTVTGEFEFEVDCPELGKYDITAGTFSTRIEH
jgi:cell wall-associated NlpC family hydrolase